MKKNQTNRLSKQHKKSKGPKGIFGESAQLHDVSVRDVSISVFETLRKNFTQLEFRHRDKLKKSEINKKLNDVDARLGVTIFVEKSEIKPDGGIIEVKDKDGKWRIVLVSEAKHQGKDIENISIKAFLLEKIKIKTLWWPEMLLSVPTRTSMKLEILWLMRNIFHTFFFYKVLIS